jgi:hypothetical protein
MIYTQEQWPKNKDLKPSMMSLDQKKLRIKSKKKKYTKETKICNQCFKEQDIIEFYLKDKKYKRRDCKCRDCRLKNRGVIEIGKQGFRRCTVCKETKPLHSHFPKHKSEYLGISNTCKDCNSTLHDSYAKNQRDTIGDFYVREYGKLQGITRFGPKTLQRLRNEIIANRQEKERIKYTLDGKGFTNVEEFARYVSKNYDVQHHAVVKRIEKGCTEAECIIPEKEFRSLKSGTNLGQIKATNCKTGEVLLFKNSKDKELRKMFSADTITRYLRSGEEIIYLRLDKKNRYKSGYKLERIKD